MAGEIPTTFDLVNLVICDLCASQHEEDPQNEEEDQSGLPPTKKARTENEDGSSECGSIYRVSPASSDGEGVGSQESDKMRQHVHNLVSESVIGLDEIDETKLSFKGAISCSKLQKMKPSVALGMFCCKMFIVNEDYILFPYCIKTKGGTLVRPEMMRVSNLVQDQESYDVIKGILTPLDNLINADTSDPNSPSFVQFARKMLGSSPDIKLQNLKEFYTKVQVVVLELVKKINVESTFRSMFERFLAIVNGGIDSVEAKCTNKFTVEVKFPLNKEILEISGRPDIVVKTREGQVITVVESKKYHPMQMTFEPLPGNHEDVKEASKVEVKGILKTSNVKPVRVLHEKLYKDLDCNVCRYMTDTEKKYLNHFLSQIIGDVLMSSAGKSDEAATYMLMQLPEIPKKVVKYGIGQVGFKIFFVTVGMNGESVSDGVSYIKVGDCQAHGLDIFCTRPLDLMLAKDRHIIAATFFAMFSGITRPLP